jgi:hypothetical protein
MGLTARDLHFLVSKMLQEGVPPGVVARVFDLDPDLVRREQKKVRVHRYGTDDIADYMEQMQWDAVDKARQIIANGSSAEQSRYVGAILGKQLAISGRRTPETLRQTRETVLEMLEGMRNSEAQSEGERSRFIAVDAPDA